MAEKELRKMNRTELIEIIYALQQNEKALRAENEELHQQLEDRVLRMESTGSIAEAALSLNHIFEDAQQAAQQYLDSIRATESEAEQIVIQARQEAERTVAEAQARADAIDVQARKTEMYSAAIREQTEADCAAMRAQADEYVSRHRASLLAETGELFRKYTELAEGITPQYAEE
ncbi:MAG: hypothetical protein LJU34_01275 [Oscillospiraceae bacterium]|nr:hypothetical protein [Oscillospiraceae bacterium]